MYVYQIGSKVRITKPSDTSLHQKEAKVVALTHYADTYQVEMAETGNILWFGERFLQPADLTNITAAPEPSSDEVIADLTEQLYEASKDVDEMRQRWNNIMTAYSHDMSHWEAVLREAKNDHGWCDEGSNEVIEKLNSEFIGGWYIDPYEQEFEVELDVTVTINTRVTVNVTATTLERAEDEAKYNYESYIDIAELIENEAEYADVEVDLY